MVLTKSFHVIIVMLRLIAAIRVRILRCRFRFYGTPIRTATVVRWAVVAIAMSMILGVTGTTLSRDFAVLYLCL